MIPTPYRAKGGAALLGARRPGELGPFGPYAHQEEDLLKEVPRSAGLSGAARARQLKIELAALADQAGAWLIDFQNGPGAPMPVRPGSADQRG